MPKLIVNVVSGEPRQVWCDQCLTSARIEVDVYALGPGLSVAPLGTVSVCDRCDDEPRD